MRVTISVTLFVGLSLLLQPQPQPARAFEMKLCEYCRRAWDDSPSRIRAMADANGKAKQIFVCSPFCLASVLKVKSHYKTEVVQIVPWEERDELNPPMLNAKSSKFLINVSDSRDRSHDPDIAAFRTDKQLGFGKEALGGETIGWDKIMERCKKLAAENDDAVESTYKKRKHRKY